MNLLSREALTIGSSITPPGLGGVAVIRVSGDKALECVSQLAKFLPKNPESHRIYYGHLENRDSKDRIDEVLVSYFAHGRSFTGEESLEISHHGSPTLSKLILKELQHTGVELAQPGEFTFRAFMNQKIDLVQAEAVLDLIESKSEQAAKVALRQLEGQFSNQLLECEQELLGIMAQLEANLDFAQEDIVIEAGSSLAARLIVVRSRFLELLDKAESSKSYRESFQVALSGQPNVGKSSLLNALCEKDLAIVSEVAGTTRDIVSGEMFLSGHIVQLFDTAGLRESEDSIENLGIERAKEKVKTADYVFNIYDACDFVAIENQNDSAMVFNKVDLLSETKKQQLKNDFPKAYFVSAETGENLDSLKAAIQNQLGSLSLDEAPALLQARHVQGFKKINEALERGITLLEDSESSEFVIAEVQEALFQLYEILGKRFDDEVLDRVFKDFCLGK